MAAALAFARIDHLRFGVMREKSRFERLMLYPDPKGLVRRQVEKVIAAADRSALDAEQLYGKSVALQGFPALALLLYGDGAAKSVAADTQGQFRCTYAIAIARNIARIAGDVDQGWRDLGGYSALMLGPGPQNAAYLDATEVTLDIINSLLDGIEQIRDVRLAGPLGMVTADKAPTSAILEEAGLSLPYLAASIDGLAHFYRQGGLEERAKATDTLLAIEVTDELETASASARSVGVGIAEARNDPTQKRKLIAMGFPLRNARDLAIEMLGPATGLSLGFRSGDGD